MVLESMETIKDDNYYILKTIEEIELVCSYSKGMSMDDLIKNPAVLDGIVFRLIQTAEQADKISDSFKERHKEIKWKNIKGFRNRLVHDYGSVDLDFVYKAIRIDAPKLRKALYKASKNK